MNSTTLPRQWAIHAAAFAASCNMAGGMSANMGKLHGMGSIIGAPISAFGPGVASSAIAANLSDAGAGNLGGAVRPAGVFNFSICFGRRKLAFGYDTRVRRYTVKSWFECTAGAARGHLEILMFRRWLLILSQADQ